MALARAPRLDCSLDPTWVALYTYLLGVLIWTNFQYLKYDLFTFKYSQCEIIVDMFIFEYIYIYEESG